MSYSSPALFILPAKYRYAPILSPIIEFPVAREIARAADSAEARPGEDARWSSDSVLEVCWRDEIRSARSKDSVVRSPQLARV